MRYNGIAEKQFEDESVQIQRQAGRFPAHGQQSSGMQLKGRWQAVEHTAHNADLNNAHLRRLLYCLARERAKSRKWNVNALILSYSILIIVTILTLSNVSEMVVGLIAILGMVILWIFGWLQTKRMEKDIYQKEVRQYQEFLSNEKKLDGVETSPAVDSIESPLTQRELEVLRLAAVGKVNKEIGSHLGISRETVKNHLVHIFTKLHVADRTSAVVMAINNRWIKI